MYYLYSTYLLSQRIELWYSVLHTDALAIWATEALIPNHLFKDLFKDLSKDLSKNLFKDLSKDLSKNLFKDLFKDLSTRIESKCIFLLEQSE